MNEKTTKGWMEKMAVVKLFVALPVKTGNVWVETALALRRLATECERKGIEVVTSYIYNDPYIQEARNALCWKFLQTDATHMLFLDDDVIFHPSDIFALLDAKKGVIAGLYPTKKIEWDQVAENARRFVEGEGFVFSPHLLAHAASSVLLILPPGEHKFQGKDLHSPIEVMAAATGFLLIERGVLERFSEHFTFRYENTRYTFGPIPAFFQVGYRTEHEGQIHRFCGEDIDFCLKLKEMGEKIWVHPLLNLGHVGPYVFRGCAWCNSGDLIHREEIKK